MRGTPEQRFRAKIDITDSCWLWTGAKEPKGYGKFWDGVKVECAHRWAHEHFIGPIPDGYDVDHLCMVESCVNPEHLEAVTRQENLLRSSGLSVQNAAKTHCPSGHEYNTENTRYSKWGRKCRVCDRENRKTKGNKELD